LIVFLMFVFFVELLEGFSKNSQFFQGLSNGEGGGISRQVLIAWRGGSLKC
jgi:hypothetical protein